MAAILRNSIVAVVMRTRPRAIPLAMITMRKSIHGFLSFLAESRRPFGRSELRYQLTTVLNKCALPANEKVGAF